MSTDPEPTQPSAKLPSPPSRLSAPPFHTCGGLHPAGSSSAATGGLLDTLRMGIVMLDTCGRVVL